MIRIYHYPRLGQYGWKSVVKVGDQVREILIVGTWFRAEHLAETAEKEMREAKRPVKTVAAAQAKQRQARRLAWGRA